MRRCAFILMLGIITSLARATPLKISVWHSFSGQLEQVFLQFADEFNRQQSDYRIETIYKGNYTESLTSFAAAFRAHKPPAMIQVFEVGTATMLYPRGIINPLYRVLQENNVNIEQADMLPAIKAYYSDKKERLLALPFNSSVPVLYYNKVLFKQAGIKNAEIPHTWQQIPVIAEKLKQQGVKCVYTTAYPSWIHLESFAMIHRLLFNTEQPVLNRRVMLHQAALKKHIQRLVDWQKLGVFQYGGRNDDASALFHSGHCAMITESSGVYQSLRETVPFELGVSALPHEQSLSPRSNSVIGGGAFWVVQGFEQDTYRGVARFIAYLAQPEVQARWQRQTGYLPISHRALAINRDLPGFDKNLLVAYREIKHRAHSKQIRLGAYAQIRIISDEELEAAFAGTKTVQQALSDAEERINHLLDRFQKNVGEHQASFISKTQA